MTAIETLNQIPQFLNKIEYGKRKELINSYWTNLSALFKDKDVARWITDNIM